MWFLAVGCDFLRIKTALNNNFIAHQLLGSYWLKSASCGGKSTMTSLK